MAHQDEQRTFSERRIDTDLLRAEELRARQKLHLTPITRPGGGKTQLRKQQLAFGAHQRAFSRRRTRFRETQGLFTTGLNLSRLRALSSIR